MSEMPCLHGLRANSASSSRIAALRNRDSDTCPPSVTHSHFEDQPAGVVA